MVGRPASRRRSWPGLLPAGEQQPRPAGAGRRRAANCRECGKPLATPAQKKLGRCADCPASYDEELFERLREWRKTRAGEDGVPAFVVFTDATLQLIAEHKPADERGLLKISGVGRSKLDRYGDELLQLIS